MRKIITTFILIFISTHFLLAQSTSNSLIINSKEDVVEHAESKTITFYVKGVDAKQINNFNDKISTVSGLKLYLLKVTDANLKMAYGKIELQNNYNKKALIAALKQFDITTVVYDGQPTPLEKFFYKKENARGTSN